MQNISSPVRVRLGTRKGELEIDEALKQILFCVKHQSPGNILVQTLIPAKDGGHTPDKSFWVHNRDLNLKAKLSAILIKLIGLKRMILYTPCSYSKQEAKAQFALPSALAFVDADDGVDITKVPHPSRIVASSVLGRHWFWILNKKVSPDELQEINKWLTEKAGGDHGHSPAKKFRLPGFPNYKHDPTRIVRIVEDNTKAFDPEALLKLARSETRPIDLKPRHGITSSIHKEPRRRDYSKVAPVPEVTAALAKLWKRLDSNTKSRLKQRRICAPWTIVLHGNPATYPGDDRSEIVWGIAIALREAGATPEECQSIVTDTIFWRDRELDGKHEDEDRFIEKIYQSELDDNVKVQAITSDAFVFDDLAKLEGKPVPPVEWIVERLIPTKKVTLLYGDGGTGKTLLALMLAVACAVDLPFMGMTVRNCKVAVLLAENDTDDTHRTLAAICAHYEIGFSDLGQLHVSSRSGFDNVLMEFMNGAGKKTPLFDKLLSSIKKLGPRLVILDTAADIFGGNENARIEVRHFIGQCCGRIAREANCAVVVCAHPSVAGLKSRGGESGSTAWSNTSRSRLYLRRDLDDNDNEANPDIRILDLKKSNNARVGEEITLKWKDGVFVPIGPINTTDVPDKRDVLIIAGVKAAFDSDRPFGATYHSGPYYLGGWLKQQHKFSEIGAKSKIAQLLQRGQIEEVTYDKHGHRKGLCTPEQAKKVRAKQNKNMRTKGL